MVIPVEVEVAILVLLTGAIAYLFIEVSNNRNKLNLMELGQKHMGEILHGSLDAITKNVEALRVDLKGDVNMLSKRFDIIIGNERSLFTRLLDDKDDQKEKS